MYFAIITINYDKPLEAAHAHTDDDRYDMVECAANGQAASPHWTSQISYDDVASVSCLLSD